MDLEEKWANKQEWANERRREGPYEIIRRNETMKGFPCDKNMCINRAIWMLEVGPYGARNGNQYWLCDEHSEKIFEIYEADREAMKEEA